LGVEAGHPRLRRRVCRPCAVRAKAATGAAPQATLISQNCLASVTVS
jgi:hypothetical protein